MAFTTSTIPTSLTEAADTAALTITVTPESALPGARTVTWEILFPSGDTSAWGGQFTTLRGTLSFDNGATAAQTFALPIDNNGRAADLLERSFTLRLTHTDDSGGDSQSISETEITLTDDERTAPDYTPTSRFITGDRGSADIYTYGTNETVTGNGAGGDDTFVIHRFQSGTLSITDAAGANHLRLDYGVTITHVLESGVRDDANPDNTFINSVTLTLDTGGTVEISFPRQAGLYSYQIGNGTETDYDTFYKALIADGVDDATTGELTEAFDVDAFLAAVTAGAAPTSRFLTGDRESDDFYAYGTNETVTGNGAGGNDTFVIHRFQSGTLSITDAAGHNLLKLDYGVNITHVLESGVRDDANPDNTFINSVTLTLNTGGTVEISFPRQAGLYSYQIGDGEVTDYDMFYKALIAGGVDDATTGELTDAYTVPNPGPGTNGGTGNNGNGGTPMTGARTDLPTIPDSNRPVDADNDPNTADVTFTGKDFYQYDDGQDAFLLWFDPVTDNDAATTTDDDVANVRVGGTIADDTAVGGSNRVLLDEAITADVDDLSLAGGDDIYELDLQQFGTGKTSGTLAVTINDRFADANSSNVLHVVNVLDNGGNRIVVSEGSGSGSIVLTIVDDATYNTEDAAGTIVAATLATLTIQSAAHMTLLYDDDNDPNTALQSVSLDDLIGTSPTGMLHEDLVPTSDVV